MVRSKNQSKIAAKVDKRKRDDDENISNDKQKPTRPSAGNAKSYGTGSRPTGSPKGPTGGQHTSTREHRSSFVAEAVARGLQQ